MRRILLLFVAVVCAAQLMAQDYKTAIGVSLGGNMGVNAKFKVSNSGAIETGIDYTFRHDAVNIFAVYQFHLPLTKELYGYAGAGASIGAQHRASDFQFGLNPNVGIEYRFAGTPIVAGLDYRPTINIVGHSLWSSASMKIRYIF